MPSHEQAAGREGAPEEIGQGGAHAHGHDHAHGASARALAGALALVLAVLFAELAGAWISGSLALLSDAAHMFTDAAALAIALAAARLTRRPADARRSFGYSRVEILAAALNALMLLGSAGYILYEAARRLQEPPRIASGVMLGVAVIGLAANLAAMRLLSVGRRGNLNMRGAYIEVLSDTLGSIGVIAGALLIRATGWQWIDSAVAVAIGLWVLPRTWMLLRASVNVLLEGVPEGVDPAAIEQALRRCEGVAGTHDLHVWALGSGQVSLSVHVVAAPPAQPGDVLLRRLRSELARRFGIHHSTVQLESEPCEQDRRRHGFGPSTEVKV